MSEERVKVFWICYETTDGVGHYTAVTANEQIAVEECAVLNALPDVRKAVVNSARIPRADLDAEDVTTV